LYIRLPSKAAADGASRLSELECQFALVAHGGEITREGTTALSGLSDAMSKSQRVVLVVAASDVTLLRLKVPPLSTARLKAALPNLAEDQLMSDPSECVLVAGVVSDGLRTVGVIQRAWLEALVDTLLSLGAGNIAALPAQLCLPYQAGSVSAAVARQNAGVDLTLRLAEQDGIGLPLLQDVTPEHADAAAREAVRTLCTLAPKAEVILYVPQAAFKTYQDALGALPELGQRITLMTDNWSRWIAGARIAGLDLMVGLGSSGANQTNWRPWRWPLGLAASVILINAVALNFDWWKMKREANALRASMIQTYKAAYPKETVIQDPTAQMRQKISAAQRAAGQIGPDDFLALTANLGEAWAGVFNAAPAEKPVASGIASLEYRERSLQVRLKSNTDVPTEKVKASLAMHGLSFSQSEAGVWQIRGAK
jgi:general secretion pathway protein L